MQNIDAFKQLLSSPKKIVLTVHLNPDADALGSALGFAGVLSKKNHQVSVVSPNAYPDFLKWMKGNEEVKIFDKEKEVCEKLLQEAEIIFSIDYSSLKRVGDIQPLIEKSEATKVIIDHHIEPEEYADFMKWSTKAGATAELVFDLLGEMGWDNMLDQDMGECLYAGIMTDTGGFKHPNTTQHIHEIVAKLIGIGVDASRVSKWVYDSNSVNRIKLLGFALSKRLNVLSEYKVAYIYLSKKDLANHNAQKGDTEGLVNYALSIKGIVMAALFTEKEDMVKMSFRSIGSFSVNDFARKNFDGGGHMNAAGGICKEMSLKEVVKKFEQLLPQYKTELNKAL
ncbi:MAG: bifunctional oligoribonuclease/PAP phosphatase NrnA [Cyclobacteriaceae bacterium]|nr:bifunctional oligoribonuclease/PAP phosphatase NrnA [Cyclobacteriaceae bacterium]